MGHRLRNVSSQAYDKAKENINKGVPLVIPLQGGTATPAEKPTNDLQKSVRLYIKVK